MQMSPAHVAHFHSNGYICHGPLLTPGELQVLGARLDAIAAGERPGIPEHCLRIEEKAKVGELQHASRRDKVWQMLNVRDYDPLFMRMVHHPRVLECVAQLLGPNLRLIEDNVMMKPAFHGGAHCWHQDSAYWAFRPCNMVTCWIAIDDATPENGALAVIPGSHKRGLVEHQTEAGTGFWETSHDEKNAVTLPVRSGHCILLHSLLVHGSPKNATPHRRRAFILAYAQANTTYIGEDTNEQLLLVCGEGEMQRANVNQVEPAGGSFN